jgi:uncharacterized protein YoxC
MVYNSVAIIILALALIIFKLKDKQVKDELKKEIEELKKRT